jgi:hypothetical protein
MTEVKNKPKKEETKAAEVREETPVVENVAPEPMNEAEAEEAARKAWESHIKERNEIKVKCGEEIDVILEKYECELTAQMVINEHKSTPQVFIIDKRKNAKR